MTKKEFVELTKGEKAACVLKSGEKLTDRKDTGFDIALFLMDGFFTEIYYHENTEKIVEVKTIKKALILNDYPKLIDMSQITDLLIESKL